MTSFVFYLMDTTSYHAFSWLIIRRLGSLAFLPASSIFRCPERLRMREVLAKADAVNYV